MAPFKASPLPISLRAVEMADTYPQGCVASQYIRLKAVGGGPLGGLLGYNIRLLILNHISMRWVSPKLKIDALRLQGAQRLLGPVHQATNALEALDRLKSRLGV